MRDSEKLIICELFRIVEQKNRKKARVSTALPLLDKYKQETICTLKKNAFRQSDESAYCRGESSRGDFNPSSNIKTDHP